MTEEQEIRELHDKYFDLVWYARSRPHDHPDWLTTPDDIEKSALKAQMKIETKYPEETKRLSKNGDWEHGFNSGMLAAIRYLTEEDRQFAEDNFPFLDT